MLWEAFLLIVFFWLLKSEAVTNQRWYGTVAGSNQKRILFLIELWMHHKKVNDPSFFFVICTLLI